MFDDALSRAATRQTLTATTFVDIVAAFGRRLRRCRRLDRFDIALRRAARRCGRVNLLADLDRPLRLIGASTEAIELLEMFQIQGDEGPSLDCFRFGEELSCTPTRTS